MNRLARLVALKRLAVAGFFLAILPMLAACRTPAEITQAESRVLTISAGSNLIPAFEEIGQRFEEETGFDVEFNFGASGQLADQIIQGAPVDIFASADVVYIDDLLEEDLLIESSVLEFARGRLVLWTAEGSTLNLDAIQDLSQLSDETLVLPNPAYAPFGRAAREALQNAGKWTALEDKIIYGSYASQALHMAEAGSADGTIIALSLVLGSDGDWILIPESQHRPIRQVMAIVRDTEHRKLADAFFEFITSEAGQEILSQYGYEASSQ